MGKKRLFVDIEKFRKHHKDCKIYCSYYYHPDNQGLEHIWAIATCAYICRFCDLKPCVTSCPTDALEVDAEGRFNRYSMRCISCKSCAHACPFGVLYSEILPYATSKCDYCLGRLKAGESPLCVKSTPEGIVSYRKIEEDKSKNYYALGENLVVHVIPWIKKNV
jgi:Fe-S-cluster-containing dehydrogenase component